MDISRKVKFKIWDQERDKWSEVVIDFEERDAIPKSMTVDGDLWTVSSANDRRRSDR